MAVLEGIRVIDLTKWSFVPLGGGALAHWGTDVIRVEHPRNCGLVRAPEFGEHSDEALRDAGYGPEEIDRLPRAGVVA